MSLIEDMDYIDADVAYLLGLITARGKISENPDVRRIIIEFPYQSLEIEGISARFNTDNSIKLGLQQIQGRILDVTGADVSISSTDSSITLVLRFLEYDGMAEHFMHKRTYRIRTFSSSRYILFLKYWHGSILKVLQMFQAGQSTVLTVLYSLELYLPRPTRYILSWEDFSSRFFIPAQTSVTSRIYST